MSVALVTGAAGIVGPGICAELKAAGWTVAASDRSAEEFARLEGSGQAPLAADAVFPADLADPGGPAALVAEVRRRHGPIALLVNAATGHNRAVSMDELDAAYFERVWRVDTLASVLLAQAAAKPTPGLELVINFSSVRLQCVTPGHLPYIAAKAANEKLTEAMAVELAPRGIRVNCLRLGSVPGEGFLRAALEPLPPPLAARIRDDVLPKQFAAAASSAVLTGAVGRPADIGRTIAYLASPAGRFINGAVIPVDGGYALRQQQRAAAAAAEPTPGRRWMDDPRGSLREWLREHGIEHEL
ncbi:MAG: SDR family NAD(P)-dependent oxidoreductase [Opitutaceae bacterium]